MLLGNNGNEEQQQQHENGSLGMNVEGGGGGGGGGGEGGIQLKKGPWTTAEDSILTEYVRRHGEGNWNAVQRNTGLARCGKSCRLRWANHLRPNLKKGAFSPEEERLIVELHAQLGNKWARMAAQVRKIPSFCFCFLCELDFLFLGKVMFLIGFGFRKYFCFKTKLLLKTTFHVFYFILVKTTFHFCRLLLQPETKSTCIFITVFIVAGKN